MDLIDKVIIVTGGARDIGLALAKGFVSERAQALVIAGIDETRDEAAARDVGASAIRRDVSKESDTQHVIEAVQSDYGRIDIFWSNAGIAVGGGPEAATSDWQRLWQVNVMAHVFVARHVLQGMLARKQGHIVGTISAAGLLNHVFAAPYGVTKAAALSFFRVARHRTRRRRNSDLLPLSSRRQD